MATLSYSQLRQRQEAGRALYQRRGREYMQQIGKRGLAAAKACHPDFHSLGGLASWHSQNKKAILAGHFPNQSIEQWHYCEARDCHHFRQVVQEQDGTFTYAKYCQRHLSVCEILSFTCVSSLNHHNTSVLKGEEDEPTAPAASIP